MDIKSWIGIGLGQIADSMKMILYKQYPELFEKIDFENDAAFTEPHLFAHFNSNFKHRFTLKQLLWSYFKDSNKSEAFEAATDKAGTALLPEYGHLITDHKEEKLTCSLAIFFFAMAGGLVIYLVKFNYERIWTK
ncbi:MAG: hypothetical protein OXH57_08900 [Ekhidna sp.]|nr:hypothetical protein [Ekhidna sp.]